MYFVYLIENSIDKSWYIGFTDDVVRRLNEHKSHSGGSYTSHKGGTWDLIYYECYIDKLDAIGREKFLKSGSGRRLLKKQLKNYLNDI